MLSRLRLVPTERPATPPKEDRWPRSRRSTSPTTATPTSASPTTRTSASASTREFIDQALDLIEATQDYPEEARYRWICEVTGMTERWFNQAAPAQIERFKTWHAARLHRRRRHAVQPHPDAERRADDPQPLPGPPPARRLRPRHLQRDAVRRQRRQLALRRPPAPGRDRAADDGDQPAAGHICRNPSPTPSGGKARPATKSSPGTASTTSGAAASPSSATGASSTNRFRRSSPSSKPTTPTPSTSSTPNRPTRSGSTTARPTPACPTSSATGTPRGGRRASPSPPHRSSTGCSASSMRTIPGDPARRLARLVGRRRRLQRLRDRRQPRHPRAPADGRAASAAG